MGRSFQRVRQGGNRIADCRERASSVRYRRGWGVVKGARGYPGEGFVGCNDPMESVLFSSMVELQKKSDNLSNVGIFRRG
jgi:hypothetical protein